MKKVGIMGGTFNPIHHGHLFLAENAYEQAGLDQVLFMPTMNPPHKTGIRVVDSLHRTNMVRLAIKDNPHFILSTMELHREGLTYTSDTLTILTKLNPDTSYYFIVGADSLLMMTEWKDPKTVFELSTIVTAGRDNRPTEQIRKQIKYLEDTFHAHIILLDMPIIEISSENIRERISAGKSIRYYVPDEVEEYIFKHGLYRE